MSKKLNFSKVAIVLMGLALQAGIASAAPTPAGITDGTWIDNFGKVWSFSGHACLDGHEDCVHGTRDGAGTLGCGALPVQGLEVGSYTGNIVLSATVYSPNPRCVVSSWFATYDGRTRTFSGISTNNEGSETPFTLRRANFGEGFVPNSPNDPSLHRRR